MPSYKLSPLAEEDLFKIISTTIEFWGSAQTKVYAIDVRLQLFNEERHALLNDRQALITQHEAELAQHFNLHASPESKIDLFLSYFKGQTLLNSNKIKY
ncbi:MAG: type II toxin-antitoxin system RelE/ParE family toxin [Colwellia sp.]